LDLFTADAAFEDNWSGTLVRPDWEPRLAWDMAQGETVTAHDCSVLDEVPGATVTVTCQHETRDPVILAIASEPMPTATIMTFTPNGISDLEERYSDLDLSKTDRPFSFWMEANHPEDADAAGCCEADTIEESVARGQLRAQYAKEYAAFLETNG
jgi:hypothetical protein